MPSESPEPLMTVVAIIAGAGVSGAVQGYVSKVVPQLSPEIAGGGAGFLLYYLGDRVHPLLKAVGVGIMAGSLSPFIAKIIPPAPAPAAPTGAPTKPSALDAALAYISK